jgi:hypothetical protein
MGATLPSNEKMVFDKINGLSDEEILKKYNALPGNETLKAAGIRSKLRDINKVIELSKEVWKKCPETRGNLWKIAEKIRTRPKMKQIVVYNLLVLIERSGKGADMDALKRVWCNGVSLVIG